jgi:signal transduction histidine kinase
MLDLATRTWDAVVGRVSARWASFSLAGQFVIASVAIIFCTLALGVWLDQRAKADAVSSAANGAALAVTSMIGPHLQGLANQTGVGKDVERALDDVVANSLNVLMLRVWSRHGMVLYASREPVVGRFAPASNRLALALAGQVTAVLDEGTGPAGEFRQLSRVHLMQVYAPIHETGSDRVIAAVEFHQEAEDLRLLRNARLQHSIVIALVILALFSVLFLIVRAGTRTIRAQREVLNDTTLQISHLLAQNEALRRRIDALYVRTAETHESFLRRVGSELHDGPAQLLAFALLRLDSLHPNGNRHPQLDDYQRIKTALVDALADIRNISAGLILPELEAVSPAEVLRLAAHNHERRTGTRVQCEIDNLPLELSPLLKSCLYRFTQGALSNAYQHAGGIGQAVHGTHRDGVVEIAISDAGPGFSPQRKVTKEARLGLIGMRDHIASLGGTFDLSSKPGAGTRLTARFEVTDRN